VFLFPLIMITGLNCDGERDPHRRRRLDVEADRQVWADYFKMAASCGLYHVLLASTRWHLDSQ